MTYTVGQAARAVGKSKSTISRAIDSGRISAEKRPDGSYLIQPVELHRVFPPVASATVEKPAAEAPRNPEVDAAALVEMRVLQERYEGAQREIRLLDEQVRGLNNRLDEAHEEKMRLTALLAAPTAEPAPPDSQPVPEPAPQPPRRGFSWFRRDAE